MDLKCLFSVTKSSSGLFQQCLALVPPALSSFWREEACRGCSCPIPCAAHCLGKLQTLSCRSTLDHRQKEEKGVIGILVHFIGELR